jgi:SPP1 family predicted phage head-tail adaptor
MRAGSLDRVITIQRATETIDDAGTPSTSWSTVTIARAAILKQSLGEFLRPSAGTEADNTITFRTRYIAGITTADRIVYDGANYDVQETREIGRRRGLEIRCLARNP